jgi:hypothetical protein
MHEFHRGHINASTSSAGADTTNRCESLTHLSVCVVRSDDLPNEEDMQLWLLSACGAVERFVPTCHGYGKVSARLRKKFSYNYVFAASYDI